MTAASAPRSAVRTAIGDSLLRGGVAFLVLFTAVHVVLAATTTGLHPVQVAELLLICVPEGVFAVRRSLNGWMSVAASAMLLTATVLALATLPTDGQPRGYEAWQFGAIAIVLFGFSLTGRYLFAAGTMAGVVLLATVWGIWTGQGGWAGIALTDRHVATLFVGTCYSIAFRRASAATRTFHALARKQGVLDRAAEAEAAARRAAAEIVLERAGPMLEAIAAGKVLTAADRRELVVIEGALRDRIRARRLQIGPLPESVAAARRRGTDVLVLDETADGSPDDALLAAATWLAQRLDLSRDPRFVGRLRQEGDRLRATAVDGSISDQAVFLFSESLAATRSTIV